MNGETFEQKVARLVTERDDRMWERWNNGRGEFLDKIGWCATCGRQSPFGSCHACDAEADRDREKVGTGQELEI